MYVHMYVYMYVCTHVCTHICTYVYGLNLLSLIFSSTSKIAKKLNTRFSEGFKGNLEYQPNLSDQL
jgi:hypothetical protein